MIRDATVEDFPALLALNAASVRVLSPMDARRIGQLARLTCYFRVIEDSGGAVAFLMAFRKGADYDSPNFRWFDSRPDDFVYIDRVVTAPAARRRGFASRLYDDVERFARGRGVRRLTCEIDLEPPNLASLSFHTRRGFREIGRQALVNPAKTVSLREKDLAVAVAVARQSA